jgi:drug/metabolite transporter (DMT)-like permease
LNSSRALYPALTLHLLISSATFLVAKFVLGAMPVFCVALLRFALAAAALAGIWWARGGRFGEVHRADWRGLLWLGVLAVPLNQGLFLTGVQRSSPAHAALFYSTTPMFVLLLSALRGEERVTLKKVAGIVIALAGVVLVLLDRGLRLDRSYFYGDLLLLGAVLAWALYSVGVRPLMRRNSAVTVTALSLMLGTALTLPAAPWVFRGFDPGAYSAAIWAGLVFLALVTSVLSYFLWLWCLSHSEATRVAVFTNFQPVVTTLFAFLLFHERFQPHFFLGGGLVFAGVWLTQR